MIRRIASLLLAAALPLAGAHAQSPIVIRFSHVAAANTPKGNGAEYFRKLVEERTKGRVKVEVYANGTLYRDDEEVDALQRGAVQMLAPSLAKLGPLGVPELDVFDLPYIFDNYDELHRVTYGPVGASLMKKLQAKGIVGLAYWDEGFKDMSANRPLRKPADFRGLRMRIESSKAIEAQMRALGSIPQVVALPEVYQALQTGRVDGTESTPAGFHARKMHEVQKYLTLSGHGYVGDAVIVNRKFWESLPAQLRRTLEQCMADTTQHVNELAKQENDDALAAVRRSGRTEVISLSPEDKREWKKVLAKVRRQSEAWIGSELIESIYREIGDAGALPDLPPTRGRSPPRRVPR